jgi:hypothetical protein
MVALNTRLKCRFIEVFGDFSHDGDFKVLRIVPNPQHSHTIRFLVTWGIE